MIRKSVHVEPNGESSNICKLGMGHRPWDVILFPKLLELFQIVFRIAIEMKERWDSKKEAKKKQQQIT